MSNPTKFNMGSMPRTGTGLVPTSYRRQLDIMSTPKQWSPLPPKPKPTMYPYRGDYVNERNRKILGAKHNIKKHLEQQQHRSHNSGNSCDECIAGQCGDSISDNSSSSINSKPRKTKSISKIGTAAARTRKKSSTTYKHLAKHVGKNSHLSDSDSETQSRSWDPYCKHNSCHQLSSDEEKARKENKDSFSSYLRSEASKRRAREEMEKKLLEEIQKEGGGKDVIGDCRRENSAGSTDAAAQKKKPPVPRLSKLAQSRGTVEKNGGVEKNSTQRQNEDRASTKTPLKRRASSTSNSSEKSYLKGSEKEGKENAPPNIKYLDFISKKMDVEATETKGKGTSPTTTAATCNGSKIESVDAESTNKFTSDTEEDIDDQKFRRQIERIVERAAEMVIKEQRASERSKSISTTVSSAVSESSNGGNGQSPLNVNGKESRPDDRFAERSADARNGVDVNVHSSTKGETSDLSQIQNRLKLFEERVKNVSSPGSLLNDCQKLEDDVRDQFTRRNSYVADGEKVRIPKNEESSAAELKTNSSSQEGAYFVTARDSHTSSDSSQISEVTEDIYASQQLRSGQSFSSHSENWKLNMSDFLRGTDGFSCSLSGGDSSTEVVPRRQIQPMRMPGKIHNDEWTSSDYTSSIGQRSSEESESVLTPHILAGSHYSDINSDFQNGGVYSWNMSSPCSKETVSEVMPRDQIHPTYTPKRKDYLDTVMESYREEAPLPSVHPSDMPIREEDWDEEPLPRGYEQPFQTHFVDEATNRVHEHFGMTKNSFHPLPTRVHPVSAQEYPFSTQAKGSENGECVTFVDDLYSLL